MESVSDSRGTFKGQKVPNQKTSTLKSLDQQETVLLFVPVQSSLWSLQVQVFELFVDNCTVNMETMLGDGALLLCLPSLLIFGSDRALCGEPFWELSADALGKLLL